jgi:hypothetical protein
MEDGRRGWPPVIFLYFNAGRAELMAVLRRRSKDEPAR